MKRFWSALQNLFRRDRADAELDEELQAYVQMVADEKRAQGLPPEEALRSARLEVGGTEPLKEEVRDARAGAWIESVWRDLRYAVRSLRRSPGFTAAATLTLALTVGANTALFSVVHAMLIRPLPYAAAESLVHVSEFWPHQTPFRWAQSPDYLLWRDESRTLEAIGAYQSRSVFHLAGEHEAERLDGVAWTAGFPELLGIELAAGRAFLDEECLPGASPAVLLSHELWRRRFGTSTEILSKSVLLNDRSYAVAGVLPEDFVFPDNDLAPDVIVPLTLPKAPDLRVSGFRTVRVLARLKPGVGTEVVEAELTSLARSTFALEPTPYQKMRRDLEAHLKPLRQYLVGEVRSLLWILQAAVGIVLLIGCLNVANLQTARSLARRKEIAVRAALGAGRSRLARQLLTESLLLGLIGGAAGLALGYAVLPLLRECLPADLQLLKTVDADPAVFALTLATASLAGVATGLAPLGATFREKASIESSGRTTAGIRHARLRGAMVVAQAALAMVLLTASGLLVRAFADRTAIDPGFDPQGVLSLGVSLRGERYAEPESRSGFARGFLAAAGALPSVEAVAIAEGGPVLGSRLPVSLIFEGRPVPPSGSLPTVPKLPVSLDYFETLGIPILRGRSFGPDDLASSPSVLLVDETFASEYFPFEDPIGKRVRLHGRDAPWAEIVGLVRSVRAQGQGRQVRPQVYVPLAQNPISDLRVFLKSSGPAQALAEPVRGLIRMIDASQPVHDVALMERRLADVLSQPRSNTLLMSLLSLVAIVLAVVGLVGLVSYTVTQRSREIGIRMALGARRRAVSAMVLGRGLALTGTGIAAGLAAAPVLTKALGAELEGTGATSASTFAATGLLFAMVAAAACLVPASRAARISPTEALRHE